MRTSGSPVVADPPDLVNWRIYNHCAAFTRLYAVYERFIENIVGEWLQWLPALFPHYANLPTVIRKTHRRGIVTVLSRLRTDRYPDLTEEVVVRCLHEAVNSSEGYSLLAEAFCTQGQCLRSEALNTLFAGAGIVDAWPWIKDHRFVRKFLTDVRGDSETADSELRRFIQYRNEAAHGDIDEVVAPGDILQVCNFVLAVCLAAEECALHATVETKTSLGQTTIVGRVENCYRNGAADVTLEATHVAVGDDLFAVANCLCHECRVEGIVTATGTDPVTAVDGTKGQLVSLMLTPQPKRNSRLVRKLEGHNTQPRGNGGNGDANRFRGNGEGKR